jgi:replicative DNA helicase
MFQNSKKENNIKRINGAESPWCMANNAKAKEIALREEKSFISILMHSKEAVSESISSGIKYSFFWWNDTSELYKIIAKYFDQYRSILTREQFRNEVAKLYKEEEQTYYRSLYDEIANLDISIEDFSALKNGIKNRNLSRQAIDIINKHHQTILEARSSSNKDVETFIQDILSIKGTGNDEYAQTVSLTDSLKEVWEQIEDRQKHPENYYGLMSGFKCLDKRFMGFLRGKYLVFTGMPNGGKTTVMFNVAMNMAMNKNNVVYVTIESEHMRATQRVLCIYAGIDENKILRGGSGSDGLNEDIMKVLRQGKEELSTNMVENFSWIQVVQGTPATKIIEMVERKRSFGTVDVLVIDYLDVVGRDKSYPNRPDLELADVSAVFQSYGKKTDILVITAQQLKAESVKKLQKAKDTFSAVGDVGVGDVSGSQKIVAAADYVFGVAIDQKSKDRIYLRSTKARFNRSLDSYTLSFDANSGRLSDMPGLEGYESIVGKIENEDAKKIEIKKAEEEKNLLDVKESDVIIPETENNLLHEDNDNNDVNNEYNGDDFSFGENN